MASPVRDNPVASKLNAAELRSRYEALGNERVFFAVAAGGTIVGALLPIVQTPTLFFTAGSDARFYNLGLAGWLLFLVFLALAGAPFVRPAMIVGGRAIPLVTVAGALIGVLVTVFAISSYGFFGVGPGAYAWVVAAAALVGGYSRRILLKG
jgi:fermentation-respiration switch protein FrsA (DUF1100 family)